MPEEISTKKAAQLLASKKKIMILTGENFSDKRNSLSSEELKEEGSAFLTDIPSIEQD